jgi:hypothetical protein
VRAFGLRAFSGLRLQNLKLAGHTPMMIIAGIDEAGYGPLLGPLVVGCCAFELSGDVLAEGGSNPPCLWKRLRKNLRKTRSRDGRTLHVNDSKLVYSSGRIAELERAILAIASAAGLKTDDLNSLIQCVSPLASSQLMAYPWYGADGETFPIENDAMAVRMHANSLRLECARTRTACVHLLAHIVPEGEFNRMVASTRNKASALFSIGAIHLDHLLRNFGEQDLVIICDRQGGRMHYGHLLRLMFEEWSLEILCENEEGCSEYALLRNRHRVRITFVEKAEALCLPVAVASMLSKYLREGLMRRFNAFWSAQLPGLLPTAGYYGDGSRFLRDIEQKRREMGIQDDRLVRCR